MTTFKLMWATSSFIVLRMFAYLLALVAGYFSIRWGIGFMQRLTGVDIFIANAMFGYIGLVAMIIYISFARKMVSHFIRYAQVASVTKIITTGEDAGVRYGFSQLFSRLGSVTALFFVDKVMNSLFTKVGSWIIEKSDFIPAMFRKGFIGKFIDSTVRAVVFHVDEVIVSNLYRKPELSVWEGVSQGIVLYAKSWKGVLTSAFVSTLLIKVFEVICNIIVIVFVLLNLGRGLEHIIVVAVSYKLIVELAKGSLIEPYQTVSMLVGFYSNLNETDNSEVDSEIVTVLESMKNGGLKTGVGEEQLDQLAGLIVGKMTGDGGKGVFDRTARILTDMNSKKTSGSDDLAPPPEL